MMNVKKAAGACPRPTVDNDVGAAIGRPQAIENRPYKGRDCGSEAAMTVKFG